MAASRPRRFERSLLMAAMADRALGLVAMVCTLCMTLFHFSRAIVHPSAIQLLQLLPFSFYDCLRCWQRTPFTVSRRTCATTRGLRAQNIICPVVVSRVP